MLMNVPRVNPDYGKDMDKDLFNARDNVLIEQLNKDFPRNNPYRNINPDEGLNMPKPEINREKSRNINEQLKKLRERVGKNEKIKIVDIVFIKYFLFEFLFNNWIFLGFNS